MKTENATNQGAGNENIQGHEVPNWACGAKAQRRTPMTKLTTLKAFTAFVAEMESRLLVATELDETDAVKQKEYLVELWPAFCVKIDADINEFSDKMTEFGIPPKNARKACIKAFEEIFNRDTLDTLGLLIETVLHQRSR
jgi:hypothetical protein